jgi:hypothetical protein
MHRLIVDRIDVGQFVRDELQKPRPHLRLQQRCGATHER